MKKFQKLFFIALALILTLSTSISVIADEQVSLKDWDGSWLNMVSFYGDPELKEVIEHLAKEHEMSVEDFIKHEKEESVPFEEIVIDGEKSTVSLIATKGEKAGEAIEYKFVKSHEVAHGGSSMFWHEFTTDNKDAQYKVLLLMEVHGEENMAHFHLRAGDDAKELLEKEDWYPTFVGENMPASMIAEELEHHHHSHDDHDDHDDHK